MKQFLLSAAAIALPAIAAAQIPPPAYYALAAKGDSLYKLKEYKQAALAFSSAFEANGWKGTTMDRYNAACCWALAQNPDSAFSQLYRIATKGGYTDYNQMMVDQDLSTLHADRRWHELRSLVKQNKDKAEALYNRPLITELDTVFAWDQTCRKQLHDAETRFGWQSKEVKSLWSTIRVKDSLNLIMVTGILDKYGWLGPEVIGAQGNNTLFLVIQHSNQKTQEKYLPMFREAVKNNKASSSSLALMEDRVALAQGKKQVYGSQIGQDNEQHTYYVLPLEDPDHVDQRRAAVGLQPLADYVKTWKINWDAEAYKKELPALEKKSQRK